MDCHPAESSHLATPSTSMIVDWIVNELACRRSSFPESPCTLVERIAGTAPPAGRASGPTTRLRPPAARAARPGPRHAGMPAARPGRRSHTRGHQTAPGLSRSFVRWGAPPGQARRSPAGETCANGMPAPNHQDRRARVGSELGAKLVESTIEDHQGPTTTKPTSSANVRSTRSIMEPALLHTEEVTGSIPVSPTIYICSAGHPFTGCPALILLVLVVASQRIVSEGPADALVAAV
jgi:hypothetical protein